MDYAVGTGPADMIYSCETSDDDPVDGSWLLDGRVGRQERPSTGCGEAYPYLTVLGLPNLNRQVWISLNCLNHIGQDLGFVFQARE